MRHAAPRKEPGLMTSQPISVSDLREKARKRLPRFVFDYLDGGAGDETALSRSRQAFRETCLRPRVLINSATPASLSHRFLKRDWALPFGIAPVGLPGLVWPGADSAFAAAAEAAGAPFVTATPATAKLESMRKAAPSSAMFQLYVGASTEITEDLIARAEAAGYESLVVTADVARPGRRLRDLRNGFGLPLTYTPRLLADLVRHPVWSLATARSGMPLLANLADYARPGAGAETLAQLMSRQSSGRLDWQEFSRIRQRWSGALVLKGVLDPEDAMRARDAGADAVQISSHGGRQLDGAPAPLDALRKIRDIMPKDYPLALDGGVRTGEDILKALEAGADFVFLGRPFLYAIAALGPRGPGALFGMLAQELESAMAQTGRRSISEMRAG
ncbi:alpha-hydroxy acid oxidase (plasmid) [Salipiger sp. H15]|uniref:Alpha-hydroxy acid oxidase n=1 Tax=Alloyangia sp. H15 TaxID=3029062 RepID=A0AAU8AQN4_9RHOB